MRHALAMLCVLTLAACGVSSGVEASGRYVSTWQPEERLTLHADGTFEHQHGDGAVSSGTWILTTYGDTRVEMRIPGEATVSIPMIERNLFGRVRIIMSADQGHAFVKQD